MNCTKCGATLKSNVCEYCSTAANFFKKQVDIELIGEQIINWDKIARVDLSWSDRVLLYGAGDGKHPVACIRGNDAKTLREKLLTLYS